jgi:DNA-binding protein H-NS
MMAINPTIKLSALSKADLLRLKRKVELALLKADLHRQQDAVAAAERAVEEFGFSLKEILAFRTESIQRKTSRMFNSLLEFRNPELPNAHDAGSRDDESRSRAGDRQGRGS